MGILIKNVFKSYETAARQQISALQDISLTILDNELVCLLGPSGCGKSTLLKILAGLVKPCKGAVEIDGHPVTGPGSDKGVVFQDYALFPWCTVIENVEFGLRLRKVAKTERKERAYYYLNLVGLGDYVDSYIHQLSGGMKQRVAIARALILEPSIILMDEPFGALDSFTRMQMQQELVAICGSNCPAVVFVTHDIDEAIYLGDRVVVMTPNPGKISTVVDIPLNRPRNRAGYDFGILRNRVYRECSLVTEYNPEFTI
jgi:sulfonate transport system ATP-binding protein